MSESSEPDWGLLPDRPLEFFGLQAGFERADLKRAYNRYLRRYKPERHPAEFQRLRAAYELLEEELRYGSATDFVFRAAVQIPSTPQQSQEESRVDPQTSFDTGSRLANEDVADVRAALLAHEPKGPDHWIQLALLADELHPDDPLALFDPLLEGTAATGGEPTIVRFLTEACREPLPTADAGRLVQRLAKLVSGSEHPSGLHPSWYYFATEPLWLHLLTRVRFDKFAELLERCRRQVGEEGFHGYVVIMIKLLRRGAYRVDDEWRHAAQQLVGERYYELPPDLQAEVDLLDWLDRYRLRREEFLAVHPWRAALDEALVHITTGDEVEADRAFLAAQAAALDQTDELLAAFPDVDEDLDYALAPLHWYGSEVAERRGGVVEIPSHSVAEVRVKEFMLRLEKITDRSLLGRGLNIFALVYVVLFLPLGSLPFVQANAAEGQVRAVGFLLAGIWLAFLVTAWVRGWAQRLMLRFVQFFTRRLYEKLWRNEVADLLETTHVPLGMVIQCLAQMQDKDITNDGHLLERIDDDYGLALYSLALEFAE